MQGRRVPLGKALGSPEGGAVVDRYQRDWTLRTREQQVEAGPGVAAAARFGEQSEIMEVPGVPPIGQRAQQCIERRNRLERPGIGDEIAEDARAPASTKQVAGARASRSAKQARLSG